MAIEFGAGKSTIFLAKRVRLLISIEDNPVWYHKILSWIKRYGLNNVTFKLIKDDKGYVNEIKNYPDNHFDLILIDGRYRVEVFIEALKKIKKGGFIIFDNSDDESYKKHINYYIDAPELKEKFLVIKAIGPMHETTFLSKNLKLIFDFSIRQLIVQ